MAMAHDEMLQDDQNMILKGSTGDFNFEHDRPLSEAELKQITTGDWHP